MKNKQKSNMIMAGKVEGESRRQWRRRKEEEEEEKKSWFRVLILFLLPRVFDKAFGENKKIILPSAIE